ncbi:murein hydrolase activator EnvC family protein [Rhodocytophaga aerolata]
MRLIKGIVLSLFLSLCICHVSLAQKSKAQLEKEKKQILRKREETNKSLRETADEKKATIGQLTALNQQIQNQSQLINNISREIKLLDTEMAELNQITYSMENDLVKLRKEYSAMVYAASKATTTYSRLVFVFSSTTFNELVMRLQYLRHYAEARKNQVSQIEKIKTILIVQQTDLTNKKLEKDQLLQTQLVENNNLLALKEKQSQVVKQLSNREKELEAELADTKKSIEGIDRLIKDLIAEEIRRAEREAEANKAAASIESAKEATISASFADSKAKLNWPVKSGFISSKFGEQPHPILKGITIDNPGVYIQTNKGEPVRAVYDGEVWTVTYIPGVNKLVAIKHGDYITVYAKLAKVNVKVGQNVKANQVIGEVFTDADGMSELQFQIWKNQEKLNPQAWLNTK